MCTFLYTDCVTSRHPLHPRAPLRSRGKPAFANRVQPQAADAFLQIAIVLAARRRRAQPVGARRSVG
jgi:hypothetical protein